MNSKLAITIIVVSLSGPSLPAQPAPANSPPPPRPPVPPSAPADAPGHANDVETIIQDVTRTANDAVRSALKTAQAAVAEAGRTSGKALESAAFHFGSGARSSSRSLVIQTSTVDPDKIDDLEEDLSVMGRILQKAARSMRDDERFNALGIDLDSSVFGSASGARNLYIDGHGALFLLSVKYPLVGPRDEPEQPAPATPADTEWERTREEMLGNPRGRSEQFAVLTMRGSRGKPEPYDESKVEGLKSALLDALRHATNIRFLAPDDAVTVVVQGGEGMTDPAWSGKGRDDDANTTDVQVRKEVRSNGTRVVTVRKAGLSGETVMTIRVKKSDIDAHAAGKLNEQEFRKKATILTYLRRGDTERDPLRR